MRYEEVSVGDINLSDLILGKSLTYVDKGIQKEHVLLDCLHGEVQEDGKFRYRGLLFELGLGPRDTHFVDIKDIDYFKLEVPE